MDAQTAEMLLHFTEETSPALRGLDARAVLGQIEQRYDDLLAALGWFIDQGRTDESLRLASSLASFWMATKRLEDGRAWFRRVLALPAGAAVLHGRALFDAGYLAFWNGDDERSALLQNEALKVGRQISDPTIVALALGGLARIALRTDVQEAKRLLREALAVTEGTADRAGRSGAMHVLAVAAQMAGDLLEARALMNERIALAREIGNYATISVEANNFSMVERQLGNLDRADALALEALEISFRRGDALAIPWNLNGLAAVAADRGDFDRAAILIGAADAAIGAAGGAWPPDERQNFERTVAILREAMGAEAFVRARDTGHAMTTHEAIQFVLGARAPDNQEGRVWYPARQSHAG